MERDREELASKEHGMVVIRRRTIVVIGTGVPTNATHAERQAIACSSVYIYIYIYIYIYLYISLDQLRKEAGESASDDTYEAFHVNCPSVRCASPKSCYF